MEDQLVLGPDLEFDHLPEIQRREFRDNFKQFVFEQLSLAIFEAGVDTAEMKAEHEQSRVAAILLLDVEPALQDLLGLLLAIGPDQLHDDILLAPAEPVGRREAAGGDQRERGPLLGLLEVAVGQVPQHLACPRALAVSLGFDLGRLAPGL